VRLATGGDSTPPSITLTAPAPGSSLAGTVSVSADATDNVGVVGVQFLLEGNPLGSEDLAAPYSIQWDTSQVQNGQHTLSARARDAAGNTALASAVVVSTSNTQPTALMAAYAFNEGSGTIVNDSSGNAAAGTIQGATWTAQGKYGSGLSFNGTSNWVTVNDSNALDLTAGMTLEAWVYPTVPPSGWRTIMHKEVDRYYLMAGSSSGAPAAGGTFATGNANVYAPSALAVNAWNHLAVTYDSARVRIYANGVEVASQPQTALLTTSNGPLRFGGTQAYGEYYNGKIDEVRVYNRALTPAEIQADMNTPVQ
jgi:hypothetical protein